jgi:hypothetical protein
MVTIDHHIPDHPDLILTRVIHHHLLFRMTNMPWVVKRNEKTVDHLHMVILLPNTIPDPLILVLENPAHPDQVIILLLLDLRTIHHPDLQSILPLDRQSIHHPDLPRVTVLGHMISIDLLNPITRLPGLILMQDHLMLGMETIAKGCLVSSWIRMVPQQTSMAVLRIYIKESYPGLMRCMNLEVVHHLLSILHTHLVLIGPIPLQVEVLLHLIPQVVMPRDLITLLILTTEHLTLTLIHHHRMDMVNILHLIHLHTPTTIPVGRHILPIKVLRAQNQIPEARNLEIVNNPSRR